MVNKWRMLSRYIGLEQTRIPLYYSSTSRGSVPIIKTLFSNTCRMNCKYCPFRKGGSIERATWKTDEIVNATLILFSERKIRGLFLSSGFFADPDLVVEKEIEVARILREKGFKGYIHLRLMPGTSKHLIKEALNFADRIGINLEAPDKYSFEEIAPDKGDYFKDIVEKLLYSTWLVKRYYKWKTVDTQMIYWRELGSDLEYVKTSYKLAKMGVKRVYYSPFKPIRGTPLENRKPENLNKVHRLYQTFFLIRDYGVDIGKLEEIFDKHGNLPSEDPKVLLADKLDIFPLDVKNASYRELILVPGIGSETAKEIIKMREEGKLDLRTFKSILGPRYRKAAKYVETNTLK
ncbi:MAG: radical SAM protein [Candidatus Njordarchaeia archaeon]